MEEVKIASNDLQDYLPQYESALAKLRELIQ